MKTYNKIYTVHAWKDNNKFFTVTQGEGGIKYPRLVVVDDKGAIDLTGSAVTYTITLPRGSEEIVDATIIDAKRGVVEFEIKSSMTAYAGVGEGELNITIDNKVLKISGINLTINKSTSGRVIEASEQFSALLTLISKYSLRLRSCAGDSSSSHTTASISSSSIISLISSNFPFPT